MGKTVYLCRHGPSGKLTKLLGFRPNAPLDNSKQKFTVPEGVNFSQIYSSPLTRTRQTADSLHLSKNLESEYFDKNLVEISRNFSGQNVQYYLDICKFMGFAFIRPFYNLGLNFRNFVYSLSSPGDEHVAKFAFMIKELIIDIIYIPINLIQFPIALITFKPYKFSLKYEVIQDPNSQLEEMKKLIQRAADNSLMVSHGAKIRAFVNYIDGTNIRNLEYAEVIKLTVEGGKITFSTTTLSLMSNNKRKLEYKQPNKYITRLKAFLGVIFLVIVPAISANLIQLPWLQTAIVDVISFTNLPIDPLLFLVLASVAIGVVSICTMSKPSSPINNDLSSLKTVNVGANSDSYKYTSSMTASTNQKIMLLLFVGKMEKFILIQKVI